MSATGAHTAPKSHGQARALGHQPCGLLVATGLGEREAGIHVNPPGRSSRSARLWGVDWNIPLGVLTTAVCRTIPDRVAVEFQAVAGGRLTGRGPSLVRLRPERGRASPRTERPQSRRRQARTGTV